VAGELGTLKRARVDIFTDRPHIGRRSTTQHNLISPNPNKRAI
jgi:hypothetical protein